MACLASHSPARGLAAPAPDGQCRRARARARRRRTGGARPVCPPRARTSAGRAAGGRVGVTAAAARARLGHSTHGRVRRRRRSREAHLPKPQRNARRARDARAGGVGWPALATTSSVARSPRAQPLTVLTHPSINPSTVARPVLTCRGSASAQLSCCTRQVRGSGSRGRALCAPCPCRARPCAWGARIIRVAGSPVPARRGYLSVRLCRAVGNPGATGKRCSPRF